MLNKNLFFYTLKNQYLIDNIYSMKKGQSIEISKIVNDVLEPQGSKLTY